MNCRTLSAEDLKNPVRIERYGVEFEGAKKIAMDTARKVYKEPMLLAWYDQKRGVFSPNVECCDENKPGWLVYAENRGADLTVAINGLEYVFVFRGG